VTDESGCWHEQLPKTTATQMSKFSKNDAETIKSVQIKQKMVGKRQICAKFCSRIHYLKITCGEYHKWQISLVSLVMQ